MRRVCFCAALCAWLGPAWRGVAWRGGTQMSEPGAGSDLQGIRTTAVKKGDDWVLNGSKTFITYACLCLLVCSHSSRSLSAAVGFLP